MNVNAKILKLKETTGYPVKPDIYEGSEEKYITFTYEDERTTLRADNKDLEDIVYIMVSLYTPKDFDYFSDKRKIKNALKKQGFIVDSIQSWVEDAINGTKKIRHTVFSVNITETSEEED